MKFWKRLRWLATTVFIVLVIGVWWCAEPCTTDPATPSTRPAATF